MTTTNRSNIRQYHLVASNLKLKRLSYTTTWCVFFVCSLWFGDKLCATFDTAYECFSPSLSRLPFWLFRTFNDFVHIFALIFYMRLVTPLVLLLCLHIMIFFLETWCSTKKKVGPHVGLKFDGKYSGLHLLCKTFGQTSLSFWALWAFLLPGHSIY
jgi:hypothetical protein